MTVRVRLAPSPTGTLHIGTARTALFNWLFAKHEGGKFLIRIEDTDKERSKEEFTKNILEGLKWLGLNWDEDPIKQSERINEHRNAIELLLKQGLAYRCYATENELEKMRESQQKQGKAPRYDNRHRNLSIEEENEYKKEGRTSVIRFKIDDHEQIKWNDLIRGQMQWKGEDLGGDIVLSRRAPSTEIGDPLYNLVVVVDDASMQISHVIRGEDHISNTAKQILLYRALGLKIPLFAHTPLILNKEGRKLSKRDGVTSINDFKKIGYTSEALVNYMALLGWSPPEEIGERFTIDKASRNFDLNRVNKAGAKFDWAKLNWLNSQVLNEWETEKLFNLLIPIWEEAGWQNLPPKSWCLSLIELIRPSMTLLNDGIEQARPFFERPVQQEDAKKQLSSNEAIQSIESLVNQLNQTPWDGIELTQGKEILSKISTSKNIKKGVIMKSLRAALLGSLSGPDLITTWGLLARISDDRNRLLDCLR